MLTPAAKPREPPRRAFLARGKCRTNLLAPSIRGCFPPIFHLGEHNDVPLDPAPSDGIGIPKHPLETCWLRRRERRLPLLADAKGAGSPGG